MLSAKDKYDRVAGWAAGLLTHYEGSYKGGKWLLFGITSSSFYLEDDIINFMIEQLHFMQKETSSSVSKSLSKKSVDKHVFNSRIRLSEDKKYFIDYLNQPFFIIGANYGGPFGNGFGFGNNLKKDNIDADFKKAYDAGINLFRIWNINTNDRPTTNIIIDSAKKYGIYLLIVLENPITFSNSKTYSEYIKPYSKIFENESIVMGYDFANEPNIQTIASIRYNGEETPILLQNIDDRYKKYFDESKLQEDINKDVYPGFHEQSQYKEKTQMRIVTLLWEEIISSVSNQGVDYSTFSKFENNLSVEKDRQPIFDTVNKSFQQWIRYIQNNLEAKYTRQFFTVGYDRALALLPANSVLDFISHHVYQLPTSYTEIKKNLTTMDRLRMRWPNHPITLGEFGYSSGYLMSDGTFLDKDSITVGELMIYLYAHAKGYSGAMIWLLNERPIPNMKHNEKRMNKDDERYEERFGLFYSDGTFKGRRNPTAHGTQFLRHVLDKDPLAKGKIHIFPSENTIETGYYYKSSTYLFIGDTSYSSEGIYFNSNKAVNIMMTWDNYSLEIMSTADVMIKFHRDEFPYFDMKHIQETKGKHGQIIKTDKSFSIQLLAGDMVVLNNQYIPLS